METIIITGANRGIGLELTRQYLQSDRTVIATCRQPDAAADLQALTSNPNLQIRQLDVTDQASIDDFSAALKDQTIDVLLNNAGVTGGPKQGLKDVQTRSWLDTFATNTIAPLRLSTVLLKNLQSAERPRIISVSSYMGSIGRPGSGAYEYRSSKAALNKVMQVMSCDLADDGIIVCPVHPGWVRTDMGGANADLSVEQSAGGLIDLIDKLNQQQSGRFWNWDGEELPW
ncbi:MAG: NAD(P)-dependent dehydrogenase (short-subunit alcohol dehydrogenase family) [Candidatus Azotimanducaceae bacterium]